MSDVPSNLIPTRITQLPTAPVADENSLMMIVYQGNNYQIRVGDLLSVAGVPTSTQVIAGTGMTGGGQLTGNVTLSIAPGGVGSAQLASSGVTPGVYGDATTIPVLTVDDTGRVVAASSIAVAVSGYVPESRQVIAGDGLNGGGTLNANVTLAANLSNATPLAGDGVGAAGTSLDISRVDHQHPAVNLGVDAEVDGILGLGNGGTARSLVPDAGAVIWCGADGLYVGPVGSAGQVLVSGGAGAPTWGSALIVSDQAANLVYAGPAAGPAAPTGFRSLVSADIPTLNQNTTGTAANVTGVVAVLNGGTGATTAGTARSNLSAAASGANTDITSIALTTGTVSTAPSAGIDIANKQYVDDTAQGLNFHEACQYASTANFTATYNNGTSGVGATLTNSGALAAFAIDGYTFVSPGDVGKRVLIKNQSAAAENGVYNVTTVGSGAVAWVLTRATDFDTPGTGANQIDAGDFFYILNGTAYANTSWVQQTPLPITVGITSITFIQFGAASGGVSSFSAGTTGLTPNTATTGNITLAGTLAVANGGTGATTAPNALTNLAAAGTGISNTFTANQIVSVTDNTNAALRITQLGTGNALLVEDSTNPDASPFVIANNGRLVAGYTQSAGSTSTGVSPNFQIVGTGASGSDANNTASVAVYRFFNDTFGSSYLFFRSRSSTPNTFATLNDGDLIGNLLWQADDGTSFVRAASISAAVDGTPGTNDMPGRLVFSTTADGASSPTERMRIDSAGNVAIGATPTAGRTFTAGKNITGGVNGIGIASISTTLSDVTTASYGFFTSPSTQATSFTLPSLYHYSANQGTIGATSIVTNQYGFNVASSLTGATNNYGFYGNIALGANRWNLYMAGTAANYLGGDTIVNGKIGLGTAASPSYGTAGQVLTSAGSGASPTWSGISGGTF